MEISADQFGGYTEKANEQAAELFRPFEEDRQTEMGNAYLYELFERVQTLGWRYHGRFNESGTGLGDTAAREDAARVVEEILSDHGWPAHVAKAAGELFYEAASGAVERPWSR